MHEYYSVANSGPSDMVAFNAQDPLRSGPFKNLALTCYVWIFGRRFGTIDGI